VTVVFDFFRRKPLDPETAARVPPGQTVTQKWPVLHYGGVPSVPKDKWQFRVFGLIDGEPRTLSFADLLALPQNTITEDIHCVTRWTRLGVQFEGVLITDLLQSVQVKPEATHAMVHAEHNYTTNLALDDLLLPNVMLAHRADGRELEAAHGGPVRLVVPHLYFWKSAKWVRGLELTNHDRPGFWESYGYHMRGDPWAEERYS
jgi:DMSO/TMAO reductase YedYZ molybdopterin-dependent catalytic subunit